MSHSFAVRRRRGEGILLGLLMLVLAAWLPAAAQGPDLTITRATLNLWPEYDDPGLLVIFAGEFAEDTTFPRTVNFPLPAGARGIQAAVPDATGALLSQPWQIAEGRLSYTLPEPRFHAEYYLDQPLVAARRELTYTFQAPYPIQTLEVIVQQPARATGFTVAPQPESSTLGSDGFTYYRLNRSNLAAGDRLELSISYTKSDRSPSITPTQPVATPAAAQSGLAVATSTGQVPWPWLLIGLGLTGLLGAGIYWVMARRQGGGLPARPGRRPADTASTRGGSSRPEAASFCTQCGRPFRPEDRFCAQCGAPRRG